MSHNKGPQCRSARRGVGREAEILVVGHFENDPLPKSSRCVLVDMYIEVSLTGPCVPYNPGRK